MSNYQIFTNKQVPGDGPLDSPILLVGEAPGEEEYDQGKPFVGYSGTLLINVLDRYGFNREEVRLDNLCQFRPFYNKFDNLLNTPFLAEGVKNIHAFIQQRRPVVIAALGNYPMHYLTGKGVWRTNAGVKRISGIGNWRGSILPYVDETGKSHEDIKVIPTYHPAHVARNRSLYPILDIDIRRVIHDSKFRGLHHPCYDFILNPDGLELQQAVERLCSEDIFATDIEAIKETTHILCVGFAPNPKEAVVIVPDTPIKIKAIDTILSSPAKKSFQFGTYDTTMLRLNGYNIARDSLSEKLDRDYYWDTLIAQHVLEPELPRGLDFLTSVQTRQPYYKHTGKQEFPGDVKGWSAKVNRDALYRYNGTDCCTQIDITLQQIAEIGSLPVTERNIFDFEMSELELVQHISNSGMLVDRDRMELFKGVLIARWAKLQTALDVVTGYEVNVRSPLLKHILYDKDKIGLPERRTRDGLVTTNDDALVASLMYCKNHIAGLSRPDAIRKWQLKFASVKAIREIREIRTRLSMYVLARISDDGRTRSTYKQSNTETGRWAAQSYVDGVGYNHQTNPRDPVEVPDEDYEKYKDHVKLVEQLGEDDLVGIIEEGITGEENELAA